MWPVCRYYCDLFQNSLWVHGLYDTMRRDSMHWNAIYVTPHGTLESLKEATNTAGDAILDFEEAAKKMKETEDDVSFLVQFSCDLLSSSLNSITICPQ